MEHCADSCVVVVGTETGNKTYKGIQIIRLITIGYRDFPQLIRVNERLIRKYISVDETSISEKCQFKSG